jgi:hypothetical protein
MNSTRKTSMSIWKKVVSKGLVHDQGKRVILNESQETNYSKESQTEENSGSAYFLCHLNNNSCLLDSHKKYIQKGSRLKFKETKKLRPNTSKNGPRSFCVHTLQFYERLYTSLKKKDERLIRTFLRKVKDKSHKNYYHIADGYEMSNRMFPNSFFFLLANKTEIKRNEKSVLKHDVGNLSKTSTIPKKTLLKNSTEFRPVHFYKSIFYLRVY